MTPEQYGRWKDFALRMARTCFRHRKRPNTAWIVQAVEDFFGSIPEEDIVCLVDWDNSDDYPEGHVWYRRTYKCPCWHCHGSQPGRRPNVHGKLPDCPYHCEDGSIYNYAHPYCMGDTVSEWETSYIWEQPWNLMTAKERPRRGAARNRDDWDAYDAIIEPLVERFGDPVRCCVRAGMDLASAPSAGVAGFTVGHLKRMYDGVIPDWINTGFTTGSPFSDEGEKLPVDLNAEPDAAGVWL